MTHELTHEADARRYALHIDGQLVCVLNYSVNGNAISFTRTFTQPSHRGQGLAAELVAFAVDDVEATTELHIVPMCWYVADWFEAHPNRSALLSR
ncbi:GNAT family N-acetyltransferase [Leifsonia sp. Root112D2]|uniref:GNAT family N-acetyltransferase n=1 Tax=Leifsonia sp. Root112D2 TaxID=1736426 RepID=UPI0006F598E8|nr:GNAT family N-acetyltransferase [Leifsonia sp. Root112D2]KQV07422.1 acetyltransferase [Leifsonia sp. Root112D2]